jgi:EAL domain-containing protein (putative c-di-GMP-specific phosphodiesterase class I)
LGVKLAIDDFGTGFSSLAYLKQLPVHELKIDKSFVMEMDSDENDAVIVRSTIDMAHNLGLKVVAEGVETQEVRDLLEILNCDVIQGYLLSRPVPADEAVKWLTPQNREGKVHHIMDYR